MNKRQQTTKIIDQILLVALGGSVVGMSLVLPGAVIALGPILESYMEGYDKRAKQREYSRIVHYMKRQNLLRLEPKAGNGLVLTTKGKKRAKNALINNLSIDTSIPWDEKWRLVLFDIPEPLKRQRNLLSYALKRLGCYQLQKSVWLHPYPLREVVSQIAVEYRVDRYITLIEADKLDNQRALKEQFADIL